MKRFLYSFLLMAAIIGCADDDDSFDPYVLQHDGENATSPALPVGDYEAGAHFTLTDVDRHQDKVLVAVDYNVYNRPARAEIRISESVGPSVPGNIIFSRDVTNDLIPFSWNRIELGAPLEINNGLWLTLYFENEVDNGQIIGCDAGPGRVNGDWLFDSYDGQWLSYLARTGESINWNIRGVLEDR